VTDQRPREDDEAPRDAMRREESLGRGGLQGVALVTLATAALAGAAALVAVVVTLVFS
jgi:hypothetical protein